MANDPVKQGALDYLKQLLSGWGLSSLYNDAVSFINQGYSSDEVTLKLSQTDAYKKRFIGNDERIKNGLAALQPADYIAMENSYQQVLRGYGLPAGFYDKNTDFADFIGKGISVSELDARAKIAHDQYEAAPDYVKSLWGQYFGTKGDAIAAILDPDVATQVIQDRSNQVAIGGAAAGQGLQVDQLRAQQLQQAGVTGEQATQGYSAIARAMPTDQAIAQRFGTNFGQQDEENDILLGQSDASNKRRKLYGSEEGLFGEKSGLAADSLGVSQTY